MLNSRSGKRKHESTTTWSGTFPSGSHYILGNTHFFFGNNTNVNFVGTSVGAADYTGLTWNTPGTQVYSTPGQMQISSGPGGMNIVMGGTGGMSVTMGGTGGMQVRMGDSSDYTYGNGGFPYNTQTSPPGMQTSTPGTQTSTPGTVDCFTTGTAMPALPNTELTPSGGNYQDEDYPLAAEDVDGCLRCPYCNDFLDGDEIAFCDEHYPEDYVDQWLPGPADVVPSTNTEVDSGFTCVSNDGIVSINSYVAPDGNLDFDGPPQKRAKTDTESAPTEARSDDGQAHPGHLDGEECPICLEPYMKIEDNMAVLPCGHYFHKECVDSWLAIDYACPVCRLSAGTGESI